MRHRPRPLHRTVRGSARRTAVSSPSRPPRPTSHGGPRMATAPRTRPLGHVGHVRRASASCSCLPPARRQRPAGVRAKTPGSAAPVRRTATCWCSGAGDTPPPRRGARSDLDRRAASWAHGGLDGFNGTWGSRQSGCCSISDGTVARVGICCYWKRHEMEGPTNLGEWSLDSILTWLIV